jgi:phosphoribosyl-dephospho-CoA transferase
MTLVPRPHDLIWLAPGAPMRLSGWLSTLPAWAQARVLMTEPLVVRRGCAPKNHVAVGIRGATRGQRHGTVVPLSEVITCLRPPALRRCAPSAGRAGLPVMQAWEHLRAQVQVPYEWGPAGSCAFELATGTDRVTESSDLDLVLYAPTLIAREEAQALLATFHHPACRCDVQLDTPAGGVALAEWARGDTRVLLKTDQGPVLTEHPWSLTGTS